jgi:hypothetical protein
VGERERERARKVEMRGRRDMREDARSGQIETRENKIEDAKRRKREKRMGSQDKIQEGGRLEEWHSTIYTSTMW